MRALLFACSAATALGLVQPLRGSLSLAAATRRAAADAADPEALPELAADAVILHRSKSALAAVAYELAAALAAGGHCGVAVATDGDGADAAALKTLGVEVLSPGGGATGYDDALQKGFAALGSTKRRVVFDLASRGGSAVAARCEAAKAAGADAVCAVSDLASYEDAAATGEVGPETRLCEGEAALEEKAAAFPGGAVALRAQAVLGVRGCDEAFETGTHPLSYFFARAIRGRAAPAPGPGPRSGGPPQLVGVARAPDVASLAAYALAAPAPGFRTLNVGPVRPHDLEAATYHQLARAAATAAGAAKLRVPLYAPGKGWRGKLRFPFADAPFHLGSAETRAAFSRVPAAPDAGRDAAVAASTPKKLYGAARLKQNEEEIARVTSEHVLFAAVRDCYGAWAAVRDDAPGDGVSFAEDDALVKDGDSLLGSLVFSDTKFHEDLGPPFVEVA